jgi:hypothetical protein
MAMFGETCLKLAVPPHNLVKTVESAIRIWPPRGPFGGMLTRELNPPVSRRRACRYRVPFAHAQAATRHPSAIFRNATVNTAPDCVTFVPFKSNVMVAGRTT